MRAEGVEVTARRLGDAGFLAPEHEAAELVAAAPDGPTLEAWTRRRETGEPLAWIIGTVRFCGLRLHIAPGVYVPRMQSEALARRAAALLPRRGRAVDLCTGSGAIAAHLLAETPTASVLGIDRDARAVASARRNGVPAVLADLAAIPCRAGRADVVTAVAPYVPSAHIRLLPADVQRFEPRAALDGGVDGLDLVRRVVCAAHRLLRPGGWLVLELGGDQDRLLRPTLRTFAFGSVQPWSDDDGDLRGLATQLAG